MSSSPRIKPTHVDESPIDLEHIRQKLPSWLRRFLPNDFCIFGEVWQLGTHEKIT